jgi:hypothetical protein
MHFWYLPADLNEHIYWENTFFKNKKIKELYNKFETHNTRHSSTAVLLKADNTSIILVWYPTKLDWQHRMDVYMWN